MKKVLIITVLLVLGAYFVWIYDPFGWSGRSESATSTSSSVEHTAAAVNGVTTTRKAIGNNASAQKHMPAIEVIETGLEIPWDIVFLPDGTMWVSERDQGRIIDITHDRIVPMDAPPDGESALLGMALHPDFSENRYVYLYQAVKVESRKRESRVARYTYTAGELVFDKVIMPGVPGSSFTGGRTEFGPDGYLWTTTYPADRADAQDPQTLSGSILRYTDDGSIPDGNPFGNGVYSYGHRNAQGITWDAQGRTWITEHGPSEEEGITSLDEINLITVGGNYGWPDVTGGETREDVISPVVYSERGDTWAPASAVYWDGSIFFGGLHGAAVYEAVLDGTDVTDVRRYFHEDFGRIRTVRLGPDGMFYLTTSNTDGKREPGPADDRIIRIDPEQVFRN